MAPPLGKMSQAEFIKQLKARIPELQQFPDRLVMEQVINEDPTIRDKVDLPDDVAGREQARLERMSRNPSIIEPKSWEGHPNLKGFADAVLDTLPIAGGIIGGSAGAGGTLGAGALLGGSLGVGAGRGARDLLRMELGLDDESTPVDKAGNIAWDSAIAGITPGVVTAALHPVESSRVIAGGFSNWGKALTPKSLQNRFGFDFGEPLRAWAEGGNKGPLLTRPSWQVESPFPPEPVDPSPLRPTGTGSPSSPIGPSVGPTSPWKVNAPPRPNMPSPTGTSVPPGPVPNEPTRYGIGITPRPVIPGPTGTSTPPNPISNEPLTFGIGGPRVRIPGASGTGSSVGTISNEPTPWSMNVKQSPIGPSTPPSIPIEEGVERVGNELRVTRPDWDAKTLKFWMDKGFSPGGKAPNGQAYMTKPAASTSGIPETTVPKPKVKKTSSIEPIIQHSPSTGKIRGSTNGGQTWRYSDDEGDTWLDDDYSYEV